MPRKPPNTPVQHHNSEYLMQRVIHQAHAPHRGTTEIANDLNKYAIARLAARVVDIEGDWGKVPMRPMTAGVSRAGPIDVYKQLQGQTLWLFLYWSTNCGPSHDAKWSFCRNLNW
ncbi:hypothetical protein DFH06DRAFT_1134202 [Mycena polygramma]|nr:hypothetical protein DFH06DRAFT_1134202 [Mycena polygramma]